MIKALWSASSWLPSDGFNKLSYLLSLVIFVAKVTVIPVGGKFWNLCIVNNYWN